VTKRRLHLRPVLLGLLSRVLSVPLLSHHMNLIRSRPAALPRKSRAWECLLTLHRTAVVLMRSRFHLRSWLLLEELQLALVLLVLPPPVLEAQPDRTTFTVYRWTSIHQQMTNWSSALVLWSGCFMSMMMDG
jgi:hypothetical protein